MNNNRQRPPVNGGAVRRPASPSQESMAKRPVRPMPNGRRQSPPPRSDGRGYTQMPIRPMTSIQTERSAHQNMPARRGAPVQGQRPAAVQNLRPNVQRQSPAARQNPRPNVPGQRPAVGQNPRPNAQGQRPAARQNPRPNAQGQRPAPQRQRPENVRQRQSEWIVPEGSPVYTAEGRMYDGHRRIGTDPRTQMRRPENRRPQPRKKKKRFDKERFFLHVKAFFVRLAVMLLIVGILGLWWYRAEFYSTQPDRSGKVTYSLDDSRTYVVKAATAYRGEVLYVDFTEIAEWFGMVSVGSINSMRFICTEGVSETSSGKGGEEYAIFSSGSTTVLVNGQRICLEAPCRTVGTHIWIPLSFVENYVCGVVCDRGPKGTDVTFLPEGYDPEAEEDGTELLIEASFRVKAQNALPHQTYPKDMTP